MARKKEADKSLVTSGITACVDSGKVDIGSRGALRSALNGKGILVIVARNCREDVRKEIEHHASVSGIPVFVYPGSGMELGSACRKPFPVSAMVIHDAADSDIMRFVKKK
jgi:large subunit ribosomal protein L30e